jgi:glutamate-ammonia-ligase adenylyltransferase
MSKIGGYESYIDLFSKHPAIVELVIKIFNESTYLTRAMLNLDNLESIFEYPDVKMDRTSLKERLTASLNISEDPMTTVREFKSVEELKIGTMFLTGQIEINAFSRKLSLLADTIVGTSLKSLGGCKGLAIVGLGRMGAAEMNIGSDLDLIFVSDDGGSRNRKSRNNKNTVESAGKLIKLLSDYTSKGTVYKLDMRLRPDGSKGILVNNIEGYRNYYLNVAHPWEIQALLRARTIAGEPQLLQSFNDMKREVIFRRGKEVTADYVREMRQRIIRELSKESVGYDIKHGPGGLEEIQFMIQYLQLKNVAKYPDLVTHKTGVALKRLVKHEIIERGLSTRILEAFRFLRTIEAMVRLNEDNVLKRDSGLCEPIAAYMEFSKPSDLIDEIERIRNSVLSMADVVYT